jgi:uncharacterized protein (DUF305 family)
MLVGMAVAGDQEVSEASAPAAGTPPDVGRGGPPEHGRTPRVRRALVLAAPLALVVAFVVGIAIGAAGEDTPPPADPPTTLKAQPVDVGFAADMYDHHEQAVQMSLIMMGKTANPGVRAHAVQIAVGQRRESGIFEQFLSDRGIEDVDPRRTVMAWMGEPVPWDQMPGAASSADIVALTNATGDDADRLFLDLMIRHHEGGIHMAEYAVEHAETQSMRDLAARIVLSQKREVNDLEQLRAELSAEVGETG